MIAIPDNVINKSLYMEIKDKIKREHKKNNKRWGAYSSGHLVKEYKKRGGKYRQNNSPKKLSRWFDEKWIDVCEYPKIKKCGRKTINSRDFPYCRPLYRVNKKTPITVKELSLYQKQKLCKEKRIIEKENSRKYRYNKLKIELVSIKKSPKEDKKYRATFNTGNDKLKHTDFGAFGMSDFTLHKDVERRGRYIKRHLKDLKTKDPMRAGYLSMFILWNKRTLNASIKDYRRRLAQFNKTSKFPITIN